MMHRLTFSLVVSAIALVVAPAAARDARGEMTSMLMNKLSGCYAPPPAPQGAKAMVRVRLKRDGSLAGEPMIVSPSKDKRLLPLEQSAVRAVKRCAPYSDLPKVYSSSYASWRELVITFGAANY